MLDLLYNYKRLGYTLSDIKSQYAKYIEELSIQSGVNKFANILATIDLANTDMSLDELILNIKNHIQLNYFKNEFVLQDGTRYVNKTVGEIASYACSYYGKNGSQVMDAKKYMHMYFKWFYTSVDDIVNCILNNAAIDDIELVGPRTKEYLDCLGLGKFYKRFGTPTRRTAVPLSFNSGHHFIGAPPITINTWGKEVIDKVYKALGYSTIEYIHTKDKWVFARPDVSSIGGDSFFPCSEIMRLSQDINDVEDILACTAYDYFLLFCMDMYSNMEVSLSNIMNDINVLIEGGLEAPTVNTFMVESMKCKMDQRGVIGMLNIIY